MKKFDAIVIGAGHAGAEAAFALAKRKKSVALLTIDENRIASLPCNPSIGGPAKGILTREIDALGGMQGIVSDKTMTQIKMLNESKGPAVRALRAQVDKDAYVSLMKELIEKDEYISLIEDMVTSLIVEDNIVKGVKTHAEEYQASIVVITTGTYMASEILVGDSRVSEGPEGQKTTTELSRDLVNLGFELQRLKTGTPPRVIASSIDFSEIEMEILNPNDYKFSDRDGNHLSKQLASYLTYTNKDTHKVIMDNLSKSTMYSGAIVGNGPRYCPSIEDKVVRFNDKDRHQIFYEYETNKMDTIYVQGFSSAMPVDVQEKMLKTLPGMKDAKVTKWAYAIEYDAINPMQLTPSLESKLVKGLFFAGQVNGTSGYEEAAGQGIVAGINAANKLDKKEPMILRRDQAYIGVLIDDLVTKGTNEPYRMLTSRAEYRLLLRNDNADERLTNVAFNNNMIDKSYKDKVDAKYDAISKEITKLSNEFLSSNDERAKKNNITNGPSLLQVIARPDVDYKDFSDFEFIDELVVKVRLEGYIKKQETEAKKMIRLEKLKLPIDIDYAQVMNLATEARQKLEVVRPETIGQASRISGINPADIQMLMFYLEYKNRGAK